MARPDETEIETARQQVRQSQRQVARQREIVNRMSPSAPEAEPSRALLAALEERLEERRAHLARLFGGG